MGGTSWLSDTYKTVKTFLKGIVLSTMDSLPDAVAGQILHYDKKFYLTSANRRIGESFPEQARCLLLR